MTTPYENLTDLKLSAYNYYLPEELIASRPAHKRDHSKLMVYQHRSGEVVHTNFHDIHKYLPENSTLVFNNTKVFACRLLGQKSTGGKFELFFLSLIQDENSLFDVLIKSSRKKKVGDKFQVHELEVEVVSVWEGYFKIKINLSKEELVLFLEKHAMIPIPPYIRDGVSDEKDKEDYQTIYAKKIGSVAAPTAGLHFTQEVFDSLDKKKIKRAFVTLHVGAGTFAPVKDEDISQHKMHSESFFIEKEELKKIRKSKRIAVGTTSLRVLESSYFEGDIYFEGNQTKQTDIFLYPGRKVNSVDGLVTNFHLPGSSLIMLVSALIGREKTLELYQLAVEKKYRFFSYGDAMLILL